MKTVVEFKGLITNNYSCLKQVADFSWRIFVDEISPTRIPFFLFIFCGHFFGEFLLTLLVNFHGHFFNSNEKSYTIFKQ